MDAQRLLIAESSEDIRLALVRELHTFHYVRCCSTGTQALEILRREKPEMLVLSMSLPELDSLTLLETIASENIRPMVLALTTYRSDYLEASAQRLGIEYIMMKPFRMDRLVHRILDMKQYLRSLPAKPTPEQLLEKRLESLHIRPGSPGYPVLSYTVVAMAADPHNLLIKELYLDAAKHFGISFNAVDSRIRRAIEHSWDPQLWQDLFPDTAKPPSARVFLKQMALLLRSDME